MGSYPAARLKRICGAIMAALSIPAASLAGEKELGKSSDDYRAEGKALVRDRSIWSPGDREEAIVQGIFLGGKWHESWSVAQAKDMVTFRPSEKHPFLLGERDQSGKTKAETILFPGRIRPGSCGN
jgi:hypothetical protein